MSYLTNLYAYKSEKSGFFQTESYFIENMDFFL